MSAEKALQDLGIQPGEDVRHHYDGTVQDIAPSRYFAAAQKLLSDLVDVAKGPVAEDLGQFADRWNPGGFMVFPLGMHVELGSLRLHVWPTQQLRQTINNGPHIHSHGWHLASRVLEGTYRDNIYDLTDAENDRQGLRLFTQRRLNGGTDDLRTDGRTVKPFVVDSRVVEAGDSHTIVAGELHMPTVLADEHAVTLVLDSPAIRDHTTVIMTDAINSVQRVRKPVTPTDVEVAQSLLRPN